MWVALVKGSSSVLGTEVMRKLLWIGLTSAVLSLSAVGVQAADLDIDGAAPPVKARTATVAPGCFRKSVCGPEGCVWKTICRTPCPDGYSCSPLYGAYGPYGYPVYDGYAYAPGYAYPACGAWGCW